MQLCSARPSCQVAPTHVFSLSLRAPHASTRHRSQARWPKLEADAIGNACLCRVSEVAGSCACPSFLGLLAGTVGALRVRARKLASFAARLLDGKATAAQVREELRERTRLLQTQGLIPGLAVVLVGSRPDSESYVRGKTKAAEEVGCQVFNINFPETVTETVLLDQISKLNQDPRVHGVLVQLPLPAHINEQLVLDSISVHKDADGWCSANLGFLLVRMVALLLCHAPRQVAWRCCEDIMSALKARTALFSADLPLSACP